MNSKHPLYIELQKILQEEFGKSISLKEAVATGNTLLKIYEALLRGG